MMMKKLIAALLAAVLTGLADYYIYLNQKIAETERSIQANRSQLNRTIREIEQLSVTIDNVKIPVGGIYRDALLKRLGAING